MLDTTTTKAAATSKSCPSRKKEKEMHVLTPAEQTLLLKTPTEEMDLYKFGVLLSLYTGIRIGELCTLTWEDLSLSQSVLKVRKTMQRIQETEIGAIRKTKIIIPELKSKCSIREIPLPPFIVDLARPFSTSPQAFSAIMQMLLEKHDLYITLCAQTSKPVELQNRAKYHLLKKNNELFLRRFSEK